VDIKTFKTIILPVVLCGCENWSHTEGRHRIRVFENRVLKRIFGHLSERNLLNTA
jgi:hypothetical protein